MECRQNSVECQKVLWSVPWSVPKFLWSAERTLWSVTKNSMECSKSLWSVIKLTFELYPFRTHTHNIVKAPPATVLRSFRKPLLIFLFCNPVRDVFYSCIDFYTKKCSAFKNIHKDSERQVFRRIAKASAFSQKKR